MNEEKAWKTTGKAVLNDVVLLAKDTGTFIFELARHIAALLKSAVKSNAEKAEKAKSSAE